jgi:hypothetical protein
MSDKTFAPPSSLFQPRPPPGAIPLLLNGDAMMARLRAFLIPTDPETGRPTPPAAARPTRGGGVMHGLCTVHKSIPWCLVVGVNAAAWLASFDAGAISATISIVGGVIIGLITMAIRQITSARADALKQWEAAYSGSLSKQIDDLKAQMQENHRQSQGRIEDANQKLHEAKNDANRERLRHGEEVVRLTQELQFMREELHRAGDELKLQREENRRLMDKLDQIDQRSRVNTRKIDEVKQQVVETSEKVDALPRSPEEEPEEPIDQLPGAPRDPR